MSKLILMSLLSLGLISCGSFKAERVDAQKSDEKAMEITDEWVAKDTEIAVNDILKQIKEHKGFKDYLRKLGRQPKLFVADVQNRTSEAYFPVDDMNDALLNEFSASGDYVLVDAAAREKFLKEITYQNSGMVDPAEVKTIGKQSGADLMIFGEIRMQPQTRDGKTIKEYSVNMRMTDIEKGVEVLRVRAKTNKFSQKNKHGW